jgi:hypothetical protein
VGNLAILRHIESDRGALSGGSWTAALPLANIRTQDQEEKARTTNASTTSTQFSVDTGTTATRYFNCFFIVGHNLTSSATVEFVVTNSTTDVTTAREYTSGPIAAWTPTVVWGADPWGGFGWEGTSEDEVSPPVIRHTMTDAVAGRYLFVYITDRSNPDGFIEIGRFLAGPYWQPEINMNYGATWQYVDPSIVRRTPYGRRFTQNLPIYRQATFSLEFATVNEAWGFIGQWQRLGKGKEVMYMHDIDDPSSMAQQRVMYCALVDTSVINESSFERYSVEITLEELT